MKEIILLESLTGKKVFLEARIADKDWERMLALVLTNKDGAGIAKTITDKDKAIARFVAGSKLIGDVINFSGNYYGGDFREFGDRALALGATSEEIQNTFDTTIIPQKYSDKLTQLSSKDFKLSNMFVGRISKAILDMGFNIKFLPTNGNAITDMGKDAMARNGIKWTIGYKAEITVGDKILPFSFDAVTDEGDGPTYYIADSGLNIPTYTKFGQREFLERIKTNLTKINNGQ